MIKQFYKPFHKDVEKTTETAERQSGERTLGTDPGTGKTVYAKVGRFGPFVQLGEGTEDEKPQYGKLRPGQLIENITLEEALELFKLPRVLGEFEGKPMKASVGRFGPYIVHDNKFYSIPKPDDAWSVDESKAVEIIMNKREAEANKLIKEFEVAGEDAIRLLNGRWGPYMAQGKNNYKLPKGTDAASITLETCLEIISKDKKPAAKQQPTKAEEKKPAAKKAAKKAAPKKAPAKKTAARKSGKKK
jgi:DNA topoisomerase-1